jgi:hypothetical protein
MKMRSPLKQFTGRTRIARKRPGKQAAEAMGRRLLEIVVYDKGCRIGGKLTLDDLTETSEIGDWKMPDFRGACAYAVSQGWLIVHDDMLTLAAAVLFRRGRDLTGRPNRDRAPAGCHRSSGGAPMIRDTPPQPMSEVNPKRHERGAVLWTRRS